MRYGLNAMTYACSQLVATRLLAIRVCEVVGISPLHRSEKISDEISDAPAM